MEIVMRSQDETLRAKLHTELGVYCSLIAEYESQRDTLTNVESYLVIANGCAKDIAAQWRPEDSGCHTVTNYFADCSTDNGDLVELPEGVDLEWELLNMDVEKTTVERSEALS